MRFLFLSLGILATQLVLADEQHLPIVEDKEISYKEVSTTPEPNPAPAVKEEERETTVFYCGSIDTPAVCHVSCQPTCCDWCMPDCHFFAGVDALYWHPMHCVNIFVTQQISPGSDFENRVSAFPADYQWGVRGYVGAFNECYSGKVSYLWYQNLSYPRRDSANGDLFPGGQALAASRVTGTLAIEYQNLDVRIGGNLGGGRCGCFMFFVNGRWVDLSVRYQTQGVVPDATRSITRAFSAFRGGALGAGVHMDLPLWCCISGFAEVNPLCLIGQRSSRFLDFDVGTGISSTQIFAAQTALSPGVDARIGVEAACCYCGVELGIRLGWEVNYYWDILTHEFDDSPNNNRVQPCDNIGFGGPILGLFASY